MRRWIPVLLAPLALAALLTGCTSNPVGARVPPTASAKASATPRASASRPPAPTQDAKAATPLALDCADLVPPEIAQQLAPGYAPIDGFTPAATSPAKRLADIGGTVCAWRDGTTGHLLEVAVAEPSQKDAEALKNDLVDRSHSVPTYGEEAYFDVPQHIGEVDAFRGPAWILARSPDLFEPGDAVGIVHAVGLALKKHG
ncbi:MAG: hypothetical protein QOC59_1334 [Microbacteriaceae bacterium]|nr:hypothetical protein [Microbacteriaceae bacterium]